MKIPTRKLSLAIALMLPVLSACGMSSQTSSSISNASDSAANTSYEDPVGGNVQQLAFDQNTPIEITDSGNGNDVVLALFSYDEGNESNSFQISASQSSSNFVAQSNLGDESLVNEEQSGENDLTEQFHTSLRDIEAALEGETPVQSTSSAYLTSYLTVGDSRQFNVLSSITNNSSYTTVTATLVYQTEYANFYLDDDAVGSITQDNIEKLADDFAGITPTEREIFGNESDVDGDGRFAILFTPVINKMGASQGGIVTGFFYALDLFESSKYPNSNEMEIIYTFVPDPSGQYGTAISESFAVKNVLKGVLPHEFQHMISYNEHTFVHGGAAELGWLNEGLSHLAEDFYSIEYSSERTNDSSGVISSFGLENPSRVATYLSSIADVCFTCGTSLSQRGGSYLFVKYLYEQAELGNLPNVSDGMSFLHLLDRTTLRGTDNLVQAAIGPSATDADFKTLLGKFSLAVYLSGTNQNSDDQYNFFGIPLRGAVNDNRGTVLNGPAIQMVSEFPFVNSFQGMGVGYVQISSSDIAASGGSLQLVQGSSADLGAYLIQ